MEVFLSAINQSQMELPWGASFFPASAVLALHTQGWQGAELAESSHCVSSGKQAPLPSHRVIALVLVLVPGVGDSEGGWSTKLCQIEVQQGCVPAWKAPWKTSGS